VTDGARSTNASSGLDDREVSTEQDAARLHDSLPEQNRRLIQKHDIDATVGGRMREHNSDSLSQPSAHAWILHRGQNGDVQVAGGPSLTFCPPVTH
jgi:hypothetical protein